MTLRISYDKKLKWVVFTGEAKGFIYKQVVLPTMLEQCFSPALVVTEIVNRMRRMLHVANDN